MENSIEDFGVPTLKQIDYSVIDISEVDGRLDAGHYNKEAIQCVHLISSLPNVVQLRQLARVVSGPFGSTLHASAYRTSGVPFIRASNVRDLFIAGDMVYISEADHDRLRSSKLATNDIVVYKIGAGSGTVGLLTEDFREANISENMIGIKSFDKHISPFLAIFLTTEYGQRQIERQKSFQAQPKINVTDIEKILVPIPDQEFQLFISSLVQEAYSKRKESNQMYAEAESVLGEVLGMELFKQSYSKAYTASSGNVLGSTTLRLDASYHGSTYGWADEVLSRSAPLKEIATMVTDSIETSEYQTRQFRYISLKSIDGTTGEINEVENLLGWQAPSRARLLVKARDVLVSSLKGSVDKVGMVPDELDGAVASTGFFVVREGTSKMPAEALFLLFRAPFLRAQLERLASGAILEAVSNKEFANTRVPVIQNPESIARIVSLVRQSFELRHQSRQYIEQAKREIREYVKRNVKDAYPSE